MISAFFEKHAATSWNELVLNLPAPHILQSWEWGQVKRPLGWQVQPVVWRKADNQPYAAGMLMQREARLGGFRLPFRILYVPKGPLLRWEQLPERETVLNDLQATARNLGAVFIKIDPDVPIGWGVPGETNSRDDLIGQQIQAELEQRGWQFSQDQIQFRNTVWVDLTESESQLIERMKQKTRYNIRLAEKKGVKVRVGNQSDIPLLYQMYAETSVRDGFVIRDAGYYHQVWLSFMQSGLAEPLIAEVEGIPVAAVVIFRFGTRAWYLYGMSRDLHRSKMPNALLQWEAICHAKTAGCLSYDFWGAPDVFSEQDPMWGVYRFKEGFGGQVVRTLGAWDYPVQPGTYKLYTQTLPRVLNVMRRRGKERTRKSITPG